MIFVLYICMYLVLAALILLASRIIAKRAIIKGYSLEKIKFIVWFFLNSFILNLTILLSVRFLTFLYFFRNNIIK